MAFSPNCTSHCHSAHVKKYSQEKSNNLKTYLPLSLSSPAAQCRRCPHPLLTVGDVHHVHATGVGRRDTINQVQGPEAVAAYQKYDFFQVDIFLVKCKYI